MLLKEDKQGVETMTNLNKLDSLGSNSVAAVNRIQKSSAGEERQELAGGGKLLPAVPLLSFLGAGMMVTTARAFWQSLSPKRQAFERTPKFGLAGPRRDWRRMRYQLPLDRIVVIEYLLAALNFTTCIAAFAHDPIVLTACRRL